LPRGGLNNSEQPNNYSSPTEIILSDQRNFILLDHHLTHIPQPLIGSMDIQALIRTIPDFPKPGIQFRDITTLLRDPKGLKYTIDQLTEACLRLSPERRIDFVLGIESRGFIMGSPIAYKLEAGFVMVRKPGKLPAAVQAVEYELEYGTDRLEIHQDALTPGSRVLIIDDLLATGGTAAAAAKLVTQANCTLVGFGFIIELLALEGRKQLPDAPITTLVQY